jgi:Uma2 family endonuclease
MIQKLASTEPAAPERRLLLDGVSWRFYEQFLAEMGDRHIFLTYDRGNLEIMTLSFGHEKYAAVLALLIGVVAEELNIRIVAGGSTTLKRENLNRGLESDGCFYIAKEALVREKQELDLTVDPPPDLAIEVEISRSALSRMAVYAALGVPEVWRYDGEELRFYRLVEGDYQPTDASASFPFLAAQQLMPFLEQSITTDHTSLRRSFRAWVKEHLQGQPADSDEA